MTDLDTPPMFSLDGRPDPSLLGVQLRRDGRDTSRAAAVRALPRSGTQRARILNLIKNVQSGLTDDEISSALRLAPNSARPRRVELADQGWIRDSGVRRPSASGSPAAVWVYCPEPGR